MSIFKTLAEVIYEKNFFNIEEMEDVIETYFKIYLSDVKGNELMNDSIASERMRIMSERTQLLVKRTVIAKQVSDAGAMILEGKTIDRYWFSRAKMALRFTKLAIVECQNRMTNLAAIQKKRNIEKSNIEDRLTRIEVIRIIEERFGNEYAMQLYQDAIANTKKDSFEETKI
jgi:hypothetical protein